MSAVSDVTSASCLTHSSFPVQGLTTPENISSHKGHVTKLWTVELWTLMLTVLQCKWQCSINATKQSYKWCILFLQEFKVEDPFCNSRNTISSWYSNFWTGDLLDVCLLVHLVYFVCRDHWQCVTLGVVQWLRILMGRRKLQTSFSKSWRPRISKLGIFLVSFVMTSVSHPMCVQGGNQNKK